jgi:5'-nucleotidase
VNVTILAVNDIHGNTDSAPGGIDIADPAHPGAHINIAAGGLDRMATLVKRLKAQNRNSIFVAGGDLIGASPLLSGLFHDEPVIEAMSAMGLAASSVGNHEFDKGPAELLRLQKGGCHPGDGCKGGHVFKGASFQYLAASTIVDATGNTLLPPYIVRRFEGIPVAFIGLTRHETGAMVAPASSAGLTFRDEADTINALVPRLKAQGINAFVVMIHYGDYTTGGMNECKGMTGPLAAFLGKLDKAVKVVITADSHQAYNCQIDGRLVTQAYRYTAALTRIELKLDRRTRDVVSATATNLVVDPGLPPDPAIDRLLDNYRRRSGALAARVIATIPAPLPVPVEEKRTVEIALGDLIADAMRAASDRAQIAFINPGGIRVGIDKAGPVTHGDLFAVLPFNNNIVTLDLTGAQIKVLLEQQWNPQLTRIMKVSAGFSYAWDGRRPVGDHVVPGSMTLDGAPIRPDASYRLAVVDFLATGGDGMTIFTQGRNQVAGGPILDALEAWLPAHVPVDGKPAGRIKRVDAP